MDHPLRRLYAPYGGEENGMAGSTVAAWCWRCMTATALHREGLVFACEEDCVCLRRSASGKVATSASHGDR